MSVVARMQDLYTQESKHSGYQVLARSLNKYFPHRSLCVNSRNELERLQFISRALSFSGKRVLDVGANAGFFAFEALDMGAKEVVVYEGNPALAQFVKLAAEVLQVQHMISVHNGYLEFPSVDFTDVFDVTLLLNVLHHMGDDFGDRTISMGRVRELIIESIRQMAHKTKYLVIQIGYCWKGDRASLLFDRGTKQEQIEFINHAAQGFWKVIATGIAQEQEGGVIYAPVSEETLVRQDSLGEFLNRPVFVLESSYR